MRTNGRLEGKTAVITGGGGSIGLTTAKRFLAEGAMVVLVDRDDALLRRASESLKTNNVLTVHADVSEPADVERYVQSATDYFGPIDIFFSNAGNDGPIVNAADYPVDIFDSIIRVHVRGTFLACKYALPKMRDGGSFIITSSVVGVMGVPGNVAYVAAKHALLGICRGVAKEVAGRGIRVNTVNPGPVDNDFMHEAEERMTQLTGKDARQMFDSIIPLGRHARPEEVAAAALFLASDDSTYTTGSCLMVDGGMSS